MIIKNMFKIIGTILLMVAYVILTSIYAIYKFLLPGRCDNCIRTRWNWFRVMVMEENKIATPLVLCRKCNKSGVKFVENK